MKLLFSYLYFSYDFQQFSIKQYDSNEYFPFYIPSGHESVQSQKSNVTAKVDISLILSIIAKEKSDQMTKSEKVFWFLTTLIAFVIAYVKHVTMFNDVNKFFDG